ncbi:MAG: hypothetical protein NXY57DRAFT_966347 [Lentinula lateritia]|uniref:Uncharacterized protein n=1 Tax=Lentinula lateritia TaxID=40482 RepID=A0ABQ8VQ90_9AGAR|nr:MAG: hypothetical protein NXY57DRAFT_966347 [Lentinula lateritia]KAJ4498559.1 hypothetical protein C8R41DRAFT_916476 [Lentinula lateritia]
MDQDFDYITFESLANPVFDGEVLQDGNVGLIDVLNHSMLTFEGWIVHNDHSTITSTLDSIATLKFNGQIHIAKRPRNVVFSRSVWGPRECAAYRVNDQNSVIFQLPVVSIIKSTLTAKQLLFTAGNFSPGERTHRSLHHSLLALLVSLAPPTHPNIGEIIGPVLGSGVEFYF